jgi:hypothetical protein
MRELLLLLRRIVGELRRIAARLAVSAFYWSLYYLVELPQRGRTRRYDGTARFASGVWCIFAMRLGKTTSANMLAFLGRLRALDYNIILINNGILAAEQIPPFLSYCHTLVSKARGGRDFGSYQYATRHLRQLAENVPVWQIIYCNDSVFIRPSRFTQLLAKIRAADDDYLGMTETFEFHYHVSSWFFAISRKTFDAPPFQRFWAKYRPGSSRFHSIHKGEIGLSQALIRGGIYPSVLFTGKTVVDVCFNNADRLVNRLSRLSGIILWDRVRTELGTLGAAVGEEMVRRRVHDEASFENNTNLFNLFLIELCDFPFIKKDLVFRNQYLVGQIEDVVEGWTDEDREHIREILGFFRSRNAMRWMRGVRGYLTREGMI